MNRVRLIPDKDLTIEMELLSVSKVDRRRWANGKTREGKPGAFQERRRV